MHAGSFSTFPWRHVFRMGTVSRYIILLTVLGTANSFWASRKHIVAKERNKMPHAV